MVEQVVDKRGLLVHDRWLGHCEMKKFCTAHIRPLHTATVLVLVDDGCLEPVEEWSLVYGILYINHSGLCY